MWQRFGVLALTGVLWAQDRTGAPVFAADDHEGLVATPDPRVRVAFKRPVFWKQLPLNVVRNPGVPGPNPAEQGQILKATSAVTAALKATPEGSTGVGFWVNEAVDAHGPGEDERPEKAVAAQWPLIFEVVYFPFYHQDVETNGKWALSVRGETESTAWRFNSLPGRLRQDVILTEERGKYNPPFELYLRPRETGRISGYPVYEGDAVVFARPGRDPWAPVPFARALRASIPRLEADRKTAENRLADLKKKYDEVAADAFSDAEWARFEKDNASLKATRPDRYATRKANREDYIKVTRQTAAAAANPQRDANGAWYWNPLDAFDEAQKRLAALAPEDGAKPACYLPAKQQDGRYEMRGRIEIASASAECRPLAMNNWDYFDPKLGRAAVQLLVLSNFGRCATLENGAVVSGLWKSAGNRYPWQGCYRHALMWRDLDWSKVAALVPAN